MPILLFILGLMRSFFTTRMVWRCGCWCTLLTAVATLLHISALLTAVATLLHISALLTAVATLLHISALLTAVATLLHI
ncbi:MAG TPA: hypothetical protein VHN12_10305, partial [Geobacteraceae bacterium]|nr:hypothetical protein [Geobacteraceae bacterium]